MRSLAFSVLLLACSDPSSSIDAAVDAGIDAGRATPTDGGSICGDGVVSGDEACDGSASACDELGAIWPVGSGDAPCRTDCSGWDVGGCSPPAARAFEMVKPAERDPERWAGARCNDGAPFGFAIRLAPAPTATWVIHLEGGVMCDDNAILCADRLRDDAPLTTTPMAADRGLITLARSGILSDDPALNPTFAGANQVLAFYCSSDLWSGATTERRATTADPAGWYFAGRANVSALLEMLAQRYGLSDSDPDTRVLWGGSSSGAMGAHMNVPRIREALPISFAAQRVKLLADAGWMIDFDDPEHRIGLATASDREVWRAGLAFWGGRVNADCEALHEDPVDCWFGEGWYGVVGDQMPVLVQQSEIDGSFGNFLHGFGGCSESGTCSDPEVQAALDAWRGQLLASIGEPDWLFSGSMRYHVLALGDAGLSVGDPGDTLREVLGRFWAGAPPERVTFDAAP